MILETTFLIDLERELARGEIGPAQHFLDRHPDETMHVTFTIAGEMVAGLPERAERAWADFLRPFTVLPATQEVCWTYGQTYRFLRRAGLLIGTNDLWIGATALAFRQAIVTRNVRDFERIPGLTVLGY